MFLKIDNDQLTDVIILLKKIKVIDLLLYSISSLSIFSRKKYLKIAKYIFLNNIIIFIYYNIMIIYQNIITIKKHYIINLLE